jgi:hypothetical protein
MGKQLNMEKRLYENQIMRKALLKELDTVFRSVEYNQRIIESMFDYVSEGEIKENYKKIGEKLADSKYYFLSATFVVVKGIDELKGVTLKEHFKAHRPVDRFGNSTYAANQFLIALKGLKEKSIEKPKAYKKYKSEKFDEYYSYYIEKVTECINLMEKYVIPHYR